MHNLAVKTFSKLFSRVYLKLKPKVLQVCLKHDIIGVKTVRNSFYSVLCQKILNKKLHLCLLKAYTWSLDILTTIFESLFELPPKVE